MSEWRPIETAPKDGTNFLIYQNGFIARGFFKSNPHPRAIQPVTLQVIARPGHYAAATGWIAPTHWMPLPEAPKP